MRPQRRWINPNKKGKYVYQVVTFDQTLVLHETPDYWTAWRIARKVVKQNGFWQKQVYRGILDSHAKFPGAKWIGNLAKNDVDIIRYEKEDFE